MFSMFHAQFSIFPHQTPPPKTAVSSNPTQPQLNHPPHPSPPAIHHSPQPTMFSFSTWILSIFLIHRLKQTPNFHQVPIKSKSDSRQTGILTAKWNLAWKLKVNKSSFFQTLSPARRHHHLRFFSSLRSDFFSGMEEVGIGKNVRRFLSETAQYPTVIDD
jgi:hypothetical protein